MTKSKYVVLLVSFLFTVSMFGCNSQTPAATDSSTPPAPDSSSTATPASPEILPPEQLPESGAYEEVFGINFDDIDSVLVTSGRSGKTAELTDPKQVEEILSLLRDAKLLKYRDINASDMTYDELDAAITEWNATSHSAEEIKQQGFQDEILLRNSQNFGVSNIWASSGGHTVTLQLCQNGQPVTDTFMLGSCREFDGYDNCVNIWRGDEIVFYKSSKNISIETIDAMNQKYDIDVPEAGTLEEILDVDFDKIDKIQIEVLFPIRSVEITDSSTIQTYLNRFQSSNFSRDSDNSDRSSFGGGGGIYTTLYQKDQEVASFNFGSKSFSFSRADFCGSIFYHTEERLWQDDLLEGIEGWVYQDAG